MIGVDANYALGLTGNGVSWKVNGRAGDVFSILRAAGADSFRLRVMAGEGGPWGRTAAGRTAQLAAAAGMRLFPVLFLSDSWADYVKQPVPQTWSELSTPEKLTAVSDYCENTCRYFWELGLDADLYGIGNETDFGICGEFEEDWAVRSDPGRLREGAWKRSAPIIRAAEEGVRRVNPRAGFVLHLARWWDPDFCIAYLEAMAGWGVQVDCLGLSFFPSSGLADKNTFADLERSVEEIAARTGRPVIVCEYAYPALAEFGGQFTSWNREVAGYPISEAGQKKWIADFLAFCRGRPGIRGAFYWSPEWYSEEMWKAFALFSEDGVAREGLGALGGREP